MSDYFEIDFLDVESTKSGDAICVRYTSNGSTYIHVVDGGFIDTGDKVVDHINKYYKAPSVVNHVVASHNDGDHAGGLRVVLETFDVKALWMLRPWIYSEELIPHFSRYTNAANLRKRLREAYSNLAELESIADRRGIPIYEPFQGAKIGAFTVMAPTRERFLNLVVESDKTPEAKEAAMAATTTWGDRLTEMVRKVVNLVKSAWGEEVFPDEDTSSENEMCVVQYASLCGKSILLTADTGRQGLQEVIDYAPVIGLALPGINRFQVPHHGSRRNVTTELLDKILGERLDSDSEKKTFTAIISSAKADEKHPRKVVVRAMHHRGASVVTTEGSNIRTSHNAPDREGWSAATPLGYPDEMEEA